MIPSRISLRERGFVSLLTTVFISLLLLIITLSMVTLETLQLRRSDDSEQSLRAYYTAESGVEEAASRILNGTLTGNQSCQASSNFDTSGQSEWTCQQVSFSGKPEGKLSSPDLAATIDPGSTTPAYHSMIVEWDQSTNPSPAYYNAQAAIANYGGLPSRAQYNATPFAAPIEMTVVQYPNATFTYNDASLKTQNAVLLPGGSGGGPNGGVVSYLGLQNHGPWYGVCAPAGASGYNCRAVITNLGQGNNNYLFRVRSRFDTSAYRMTFMTGANGDGTTVSVPDGTATIDVTAKAGQTYRRVISKLPVGNTANEGLNYVMYSDTDICKSFEVLGSSASPNCGATTPVPTPPPSACKLVGPNIIPNGDFSQPLPNRPNVSGIYFDTLLPYRGVDVYPDDDGNYAGSIKGYSGGFSVWDRPIDVYNGSQTIQAPLFAGDPASGIPGASHLWYSNPNQSYPPTTFSKPGNFTGTVWQENLTGLTPGQTYKFVAYFFNLLPSDGKGNATTVDPKFSLLVDGVPLIDNATIPKHTSASVVTDPLHGWQALGGQFVTKAGQTSVTLTVNDKTGTYFGDDFGMTALTLFECK